MARQMVTCVECGKAKRIAGHGLCGPCYYRHQRNGTLGRFSTAVASTERQQIARAKARVREMGLA